MEYKYPIAAINSDGTTALLYSYDAVVEFKKKKIIGDHHVVRIYSFIHHQYIKSYYEWILRDEWGRKVDPKDFAEPRYRAYWAFGRWKDAREAAERGLPIPGTGQRRYYRRRKSSSDKGRNGTYNRDKGLKLYEDPKIHRGELDDF